MVEEEPAVKALGEVDLKGEAALVHEVRAAGQLHVPVPPASETGVAGHAVARGGASFSPAVCVLRAAARPGAHAHVHVGGVDVQDARRYGEHVEKAPARKAGVHVLRRGVLGDVEPAARRGRSPVQVDRYRIVGQVGVVDAVAAHVLARRPLRAELCHLRKACGKLVGCPHKYGNAAGTPTQLHQWMLRREGHGVVAANRCLVAAQDHVDGLCGLAAGRRVGGVVRGEGHHARAVVSRHGPDACREERERLGLAGKVVRLGPRKVCHQEGRAVAHGGGKLAR